MNKQQIENWLIARKGYLKKSPIEVAKMLWKSGEFKVKNEKELKKELEVIKQVQVNLRKATELQEDNLLNLYNQIAEKKKNPKLLFFDLEVSPNTVFSWNVGRKISIGPENIIDERKILCVCWKFEGNDKIYSLEWNKGCDKELVKKFADIFNSSDIIIGQNSDNFDIKWLRTRCLIHNIPLKHTVNSMDTLKMARQYFRFNSNRLDYLSKFIGNEGKTETGFGLWRDIVLKNDKKAMNTMVSYCKNDIKILEQVYNTIKPYCKEKKFKFA